MAPPSDYDWAKEVEEFESSKAGVKGLVDSGITKISRFFHYPPSSLLSENAQIQLKIPVEIVEEIKGPAQSWGFFQIVNHGVPVSNMDAILESTRKFHEQPKEDKMDLYSSDNRHKVRLFTINGSFNETHVVNWRDALPCSFLDEALGLSRDYLAQMDCLKSEYLTCLYYPPCPEPELALGTISHSDSTFLTMVVLDSSGVPPGAIVVNIGDLMQLITNDKFKSVEHRVLARPVGSRVSAACFLYPSSECILKPYGPIKELFSEEDPQLYKSQSNLEYMAYYQKNVRECTSSLPHFKQGVKSTISACMISYKVVSSFTW
ncbi:unnamed protein product [Withania somnifera]